MLALNIINSCYNLNDRGCSDIKGLANRTNRALVIFRTYCNTTIMKSIPKLVSENKLK